MQVILGSILSSERGTKLSIKYCEKQSFDGISLCYFSDENEADFIAVLKDVFHRIKEKNPFLHNLLIKRCKAIFLLESPPYGFQLNNGVFYLNKELVENREISIVYLLLLQLLYQYRVYEKIGIGSDRSICNKNSRNRINNRFMKPAWKKYDRV